MDVLGQALLDYQAGNYTEDITTFLSLQLETDEVTDILPLPYLFRTFEEMPRLERAALNLCKGKVLDIGCGAGSHSLYLQENGISVTALDASAGAVETCKRRGVQNYSHSEILAFRGGNYDTLLLLMNGIGIAGTLAGLHLLLKHLKSLLKPNGQVILDSSDISYMFDDEEGGEIMNTNDDAYYGEVTFRMEYKKKSGTPFHWLYVDYHTLKKVARTHQLHCELVSKGEHNDYLARITSE